MGICPHHPACAPFKLPSVFKNTISSDAGALTQKLPLLTRWLRYTTLIAGRSAHSASPSRDLPVAGLFVSFSPFSVLGLFVVFEGLYVLWIGGGYVKRLLGYSVVLRTLWKVEILGNRPLGRCWGGPAFLGPPGSKAWTS